MAESDMRSKLVKALKPLDAVAVENPAGPGTPDVNCIPAWLECKWLRAWPKRDSTPVTLDHPLMTDQKVWLKKRHRRGGVAFVILQCRREWFLFDVPFAVTHLGTATRQELTEGAYTYWKMGLNAEELMKVLLNEAKL